MKIKLLSIFLFAGILIFGCKGGGLQLGKKNSQQLEVSGVVRGGYRNISVDVGRDTLDLVVYRGDYIKFQINDKGASRTEYGLVIPKLNINKILVDNSTEQPYFKIKESGRYSFMIGDQLGILEVVELRQANYSEVSAEEAWKLMIKNPRFVLDVRTKPEFNAGHISGATLIPLQELQERINELDLYLNQPILIYCATGNRSTTASKILLDEDYKNVMNLRMGIMGWGSKGYNVEF
ncbi:hypothetical protein HQ531_11485 [bacterium]|nr:hypothetical protein [bacterium]